MTKTFIIAVAASVVLAAGAHAQKKNEPAPGNDSIFSSDSNLVLVDSTVTDKKGDYIADLTRKNFKVREDSKEQTITTFSYEADGTPDDQKRFLVLLFDDSTVPQVDQHYAREAAIKFIGSNAGPNRLMAVVEYDGNLRVTQNLTDDVDRLKQTVIGAKMSVTSSGTMGSIGSMGNRYGTNTASALPEALRNVAKGLTKVRGRKTIVLFSEGIIGNPDQTKGALDECNRANVAIYPVDIRALGGTAGIGSASGGRLSMQLPANVHPIGQGLGDLSAPPPASDALYGLARGTGGFVLSSPAKLADELNKIGKEESQYYVLGYLPSKELKPDTCHTLKVEVDRGGASVRARNSYCDVKTPEVVTGTPTERDLEGRLNADATPTVQATMQAPFFYVAPNTARVNLALDIPGAGVKFAKDKGKFAAVLNIIGIAYLPDGGVAARFNDTAKVMLDDQQQADEFASHSYHFEKQFEMASGTFDLKVAFSSGAASFGKVETQLTIDPWVPSKFLLSGLALSQSTHPASSEVLGSEMDLFGDKVPLVANGVQFIPAGTNRLRKSEKAFIYGEIYEPAVTAPNRKDDPGLGAQLTLLDARTGEIVKRTGLMGLKPETVPGTSAVPLGMMLPTDELAPGSYAAEITVQDAAGNRSLRRIAFELER